MVRAHIILGGPFAEIPTPSSNEERVYIGVDKGALFLIENGITPDLAIGDFDSITVEERSMIRKKAKHLEAFQAEKDDTDTELALLHTMERFKPESITLHNWTGGRMDHLISILFLVLQPRFYDYIPNLRLVNESNTVSFYLPGEYSIEKEADKKYLSYIGMTPIKALTLKNVKYTLDEADFNYPAALISNEFIDDRATFSFEEGIVAVVQARD
jgi:thiamine pyrophosphokinase